MKISAGSLPEALALIGANEKARDILIDALRRAEAALDVPGRETREVITGPLLDAMHPAEAEVTKALADGTIFTARYTSKIIRDFVMAPDACDHVWEPQTTRAALHFAQSSSAVVVGGAYIGDHAVLMAAAMRGRGRVHCFEPSSNADLLARNAAQNGLDNVVVNRLGLWSVDNARLTLVGDDSHAYPKLAEPGHTAQFEAVTIDGYGARHNLARIDFILLDIEGGEIEALKGAQTYLGKPALEAPVVLFEVHRSYTDWSNGIENAPIVRLLTDAGYEVFGLRDYNSNVSMAGKPIELVKLDGMYLEGPPHGFNMLAIKSRDQLAGGAFSIVCGVSPKLLKHRDPRYHAPLS